jgi:putative ABC transport system substrate-binding protein
MRRRHLLAAGPALLVCARLGWAQQPGRVYRLGVLVFRGSSAASRDPAFAAFLDELARAGFVEGKNLLLDNSGISNRTDELPERAARLVAEGVDVIFSAGAPATAAALHATAEKPIAAIVDDMLASGLVPSLSQPGGNLTGISILATELDGKRQEILFELLPKSRRMAALADPGVGSPSCCQNPVEWRRSPIRALARRPIWRASATRLCSVASSFRSIRSATQRRSPARSRRRELAAPRRSTCWPRRCSIRTVG